MLRLARTHVSTDASAEDVVQDTWMAVIQGIDRFEGRSSLRTWVYRILINTAKKKGVREHRTVPSESLSVASDDRGPTVDPARFRGPDDQYPGGWREFPAPWPSAEGAVLAGEVRGEIAQALDTLPERQRVVITLRDVWAIAPTKCARCSRSQRSTSECCCTAPGPESDISWPSTTSATVKNWRRCDGQPI